MQNLVKKSAARSGGYFKVVGGAEGGKTGLSYLAGHSQQVGGKECLRDRDLARRIEGGRFSMSERGHGGDVRVRGRGGGRIGPEPGHILKWLWFHKKKK